MPVDPGHIDIVREHAYPIGAPEGEEYERDAVRKFLEAIVHIRGGKDPSVPSSIPAVRDEARRVFGVCLKAIGF
jgi:hypothetical protein